MIYEGHIEVIYMNRKDNFSGANTLLQCQSLPDVSTNINRALVPSWRSSDKNTTLTDG
jgi:hypothetical protein